VVNTQASYTIGQVVPYHKPRGVVSDIPCAPRWNALRVPPGQEAAKTAMLRSAGVFAMFPKEERTRFKNGKKIVTEHATVTQLIYARFTHEPQWDVMKDRRIIAGVICHNARPVNIHPDIIRQVQGLPTEAERIAEAKRQMQEALYRVEPGDKAEILEGPLAGLVVEISAVQGKRIWWMPVGGGIKGEASHGSLRRVEP